MSTETRAALNLKRIKGKTREKSLLRAIFLSPCFDAEEPYLSVYLNKKRQKGRKTWPLLAFIYLFILFFSVSSTVVGIRVTHKHCISVRLNMRRLAHLALRV